MHHRIRKVIVGDDQWKCGMIPHLSLKVFKASVEIMISHGGAIILHGTHQFNIGFTQVKIKVRGSLKNIASIKEQNMLIFLADFFNHSRTHRSTPKSRITRSIIRKGLQAAMHIIGVQYDQPGEFFLHVAKGIKPSRHHERCTCGSRLLKEGSAVTHGT